MSQADIEAQRKALLELADKLDMIFDRIALTAKEIHILVQQIALRQAAKELHKHTPDEKAPWRCAECGGSIVAHVKEPQR